MKRTVLALLLSGFVLPGLGQLYLGRKARGIALILLVNLLLLLSVFVLMKGLSPVIASRIMSGAVDSRELMTSINESSGFGRALLAGFFLIWAYSIGDIVAGRKEHDTANEDQ